MAEVILEPSQDGCREDSLGTASVKRQDLETPITLIQQFSLLAIHTEAFHIIKTIVLFEGQTLPVAPDYPV